MTIGTRFTELVGCRLPLQLAVLGGVGTAELALAVAEAGGLGMAPWTVDLARHGGLALGKGFLLPYFSEPAQVPGFVAGLGVAEFFWGDPDPRFVDAGHRAGALVSWQVGSAAEAKAAAAAGCDLVVAQGVEAGGHVRGRHRLDDLLAEVLHSIEVPVVAAGGIGSAERVAELIERGADAVRIGTRFLATPEADVHPSCADALIAASAEDAVITPYFDDEGGWPAPVRVLAASLERAQAAGNRYTMPADRSAANPLAMPLYAGLSVDGVTEVKPAAAVVSELVSLLA